MEWVQKIVGDWRSWRIHPMHPSNWAEWRTQNEGCLPRILPIELAFSDVWWRGSREMQPLWDAAFWLRNTPYQHQLQYRWRKKTRIKCIYKKINALPKSPKPLKRRQNNFLDCCTQAFILTVARYQELKSPNQGFSASVANCFQMKVAKTGS